MKKICKAISLMLAFLIVIGTIGVSAANDGTYLMKRVNFEEPIVEEGGEKTLGPSPLGTSRDDRKKLKTLYVCRGVVGIGSREFSCYYNLSRIELPDTVVRVGYQAFVDAPITRIGIPKSVTTIDNAAFFNTCDHPNRDSMVIYCEKGSKAEEFAKKHYLQYVIATIIYGTEGRTMMVDDEERKAYLASGNWFATPDPVKMYAADGRTKWVEKSEVSAYKKVGWYTEPLIKMYAADGRTKMVEKSKVEAYKKVGWYNGKPVVMYSLDGRTKTVGANEVEAYKKVGWYNGKPVKMYAADGRTKTVGASEVEANKKVGWYTEPFVTMYAAGGKTKLVEKSKVEAYKKVGWYTERLVKLYTYLGARSIYVEESKVDAYRKVGWYYWYEIAARFYSYR